MTPVATVLAVIVLVSITASPVLTICLWWVSSHTARYLESGDQASGVAITRSVKNECERFAAVAYSVKAGPLVQALPETMSPFGATDGSWLSPSSCVPPGPVT